MSQRNGRSVQPGLDGVTHWLIRQAARRAPGCLSSRLEEEWLAASECLSSALAKLRFAVGCCWAAVVIANDYPRSRVSAASPAVASGGYGILAERNFNYFSLRSGTLFLIVGIYAALFCGLATTLSHSLASAVPANLQNRVVPPVPTEIEIIRLLPAK